MSSNVIEEEILKSDDMLAKIQLLGILLKRHGTEYNLEQISGRNPFSGIIKTWSQFVNRPNKKVASIFILEGKKLQNCIRLKKTTFLSFALCDVVAWFCMKLEFERFLILHNLSV